MNTRSILVLWLAAALGLCSVANGVKANEYPGVSIPTVSYVSPLGLVHVLNYTSPNGVGQAGLDMRVLWFEAGYEYSGTPGLFLCAADYDPVTSWHWANVLADWWGGVDC